MVRANDDRAVEERTGRGELPRVGLDLDTVDGRCPRPADPPDTSQEERPHPVTLNMPLCHRAIDERRGSGGCPPKKGSGWLVMVVAFIAVVTRRC